MRRQRGIADGWLLLTFLLLGLGGAVYGLHTVKQMMNAEYERGKQEVQARFDIFKTEVAEMGRKAQKIADGRKADERKRMEKADANTKRALAAMRADNKRLRDERDSARGNILPPAPTGAERPERASVERAEFERAYRELVEGLRSVGDEGDEARVKLDEAKRWEQQP